MRDFTFNEKTHFYEADEGLHTIRIGADVFMMAIEELIATGLTEEEAKDELFRVDTWYGRLPCPDVFIDGIEQTDE
jgi:hypothetical protein